MSEEKSKSSIEEALSSISLGTIISGFWKYVECVKGTFIHQGAYIACLKEKDPGFLTLGTAFSTYLYGVALSFAIYAPIIAMNDLPLDKAHFLLQFLYMQCLYILLLHAAIKIFRGHGALRDTATIYFFYIGVVTPLVLAVNYPTYIYAPATDFVNVAGQPPDRFDAMPLWVKIWALVGFVLILVFGYRILLRWMADAHEITRRRLIAALTVVALPVMFAHNIYVAPRIGGVIDVASKVVEKIN